jgi:hypothetical protein
LAEEGAPPKKKGFLPKFGGSKTDPSPGTTKPKKNLFPAFGKKRAVSDAPPADTEDVEFMELEAEPPEMQGDVTNEAGPSPSDAPEPLGETPAVTGESLVDEPEETADREITIELPEGEDTQEPAPIEEPAPTRRAMTLPKIHFGGAKGKKVREEAIVASELDAPPIETEARPARKLPSLKPTFRFGKKKGPLAPTDEPRTMRIPGESSAQDAPVTGSSSDVASTTKKRIEIPQVRLPFRLGRKKEDAAPASVPEPTTPEPTVPTPITGHDAAVPGEPHVETTETMIAAGEATVAISEDASAPPPEPTMSILETSVEGNEVPPPRPTALKRAYDYEAIHTRIDDILRIREYHGLPPGAPMEAPAPGTEWKSTKSSVSQSPAPLTAKQKRAADKRPSSGEPVDDQVDRILREKGKLPSNK